MVEDEETTEELEADPLAEEEEVEEKTPAPKPKAKPQPKARDLEAELDELKEKVAKAPAAVASAPGEIEKAVEQVLSSKDHEAEHEALRLLGSEKREPGPLARFLFYRKAKDA